MKEIKTDLRYIKTKEVIHTAFRELLRIMPYDRITVKLLAEKAKINRKTFYLHYDTLDELMNELSHEIVLTGIAKIQQYTIPQDLKNIIFTVYQYWHSLTPDETRIFRISSASVNAVTFAQQMKDTFENFNPSFCDGDIQKQKTVLAFIVGAMGTLYREWIIYHAASSIDEAVELTYKMIANGISDFFV